MFRQLDPAEQARMRRKLDVMREYAVILGERISAFLAFRHAPAGWRILEIPVSLSFDTSPKILLCVAAVILAACCSAHSR